MSGASLVRAEQGWGTERDFTVRSQAFSRTASEALPALLPLSATLSALPVPGLEIAETLHDAKEVVSFPSVYINTNTDLICRTSHRPG